MKKLLTTVALAALVVLGGGCVTEPAGGLAAGVGVYVYANGEVKAIEPVPLERAKQAVLAAVLDLQYPILSQSKDELTIRGSREQEIVITVTRQSEDSTEIGIRVGSLGDEAQSNLILQQIKKRL